MPVVDNSDSSCQFAGSAPMQTTTTMDLPEWTAPLQSTDEGKNNTQDQSLISSLAVPLEKRRLTWYEK